MECNVGVPYDKFKPEEGVISGKLTRENPLPNNMIQLQSYNTETKGHGKTLVIPIIDIKQTLHLND